MSFDIDQTLAVELRLMIAVIMLEMNISPRCFSTASDFKLLCKANGFPEDFRFLVISNVSGYYLFNSLVTEINFFCSAFRIYKKFPFSFYFEVQTTEKKDLWSFRRIIYLTTFRWFCMIQWVLFYRGLSRIFPIFRIFYWIADRKLSTTQAHRAFDNFRSIIQ